MSKTAVINLRVDPETKQGAETILASMGLNLSTAIDMYLNQIILKKGIPFSVDAMEGPDYLNPDKVSLEEFAASIQRGHDDIAAGRYYTLDEAFGYLKEKYKV